MTPRPETAPPEPVATFAARVGWRVRFSEVIFAEPPYLVMQASPVFPGANPKPRDPDIVWDVLQLVEAAQRAGGYGLITCSCGYASHAGIEQLVLVSHPDPDTIVWEIDIPGLRPILAAEFADVAEGFIRLVFARAQYEADVRSLFHELQACLRAPIDVSALADDVCGVTHLRREHPTLDRIAVEVFEPETSGTEIDALLAFEIDAAWPRAGVFPPGTTITFGFHPFGSGHDLMRIEGAPRAPDWPVHCCTRWAVLDAFERWTSFVTRVYRPKSDNARPAASVAYDWTLRAESDRAACHDAGRVLAARMQASLDEGLAAPGARVTYCECPLAAATPDTPHRD